MTLSGLVVHDGFEATFGKPTPHASHGCDAASHGIHNPLVLPSLSGLEDASAGVDASPSLATEDHLFYPGTLFVGEVDVMPLASRRTTRRRARALPQFWFGSVRHVWASSIRRASITQARCSR